MKKEEDEKPCGQKKDLLPHDLHLMKEENSMWFKNIRLTVCMRGSFFVHQGVFTVTDCEM